MAWPITMKAATILISQGNTTYTKEKPWHGRSGGGLCDLDAKVLIGVVQGYEVPPWGRRGIYVSHQAILRFLRTQPRAGEQQTPLPRNPFHLLPCPT